MRAWKIFRGASRASTSSTTGCAASVLPANRNAAATAGRDAFIVGSFAPRILSVVGLPREGRIQRGDLRPEVALLRDRARGGAARDRRAGAALRAPRQAAGVPPGEDPAGRHPAALPAAGARGRSREARQQGGPGG